MESRSNLTFTESSSEPVFCCYIDRVESWHVSEVGCQSKNKLKSRVGVKQETDETTVPIVLAAAKRWWKEVILPGWLNIHMRKNIRDELFRGVGQSSFIPTSLNRATYEVYCADRRTPWITETRLFLSYYVILSWARTKLTLKVTIISL